MDVKFIDKMVTSESARKAYITLFKRIDEYQKLINKNIKSWDKDDCLNMLSEIGSKKYNTIAVKWSLLKKYLIYIGNDAYNDITKKDLEGIEDRALKYIPFEDVVKAVDMFQNNIDKALILLLRNGIKGSGFEELTNIKKEDIEGNVIKLENRDVILDDFTADIVHKALAERGYHMNVDYEKRIAYSYYAYNPLNEYFWKNRPTFKNNEGLDAIKPNASRDKIIKLIRKLDNEDFSSTALVMSYVVDEILKIEKQMNITLSETQVSSFIKNMGIKVNMYSVYVCKNELNNK